MDINTVKLQNIPPQQGSLMLSFYNPTHIPPVPTPSLTLATTNVFYISVFWLIFLFVAPVFVATCGLSLVASGTTLWLGRQASHCGGFSHCWTQALSTWASVVEVHRLSCSMVHGISQIHGSNLRPLHGRQILFHCTTREVLCIFVILRMLYKWNPTMFNFWWLSFLSQLNSLEIHLGCM